MIIGEGAHLIFRVKLLSMSRMLNIEATVQESVHLLIPK